MNDRNVILSIIIPVYNAEKFIVETVTSVMESTYQKFELILVDDASKDASGQLCDAIAKEYPWVKVIHHKYNLGLSKSREDGFQLAQGDWISFIDHDDKISPQMYECLMNNAFDADIICIRGEERNTGNFDSIEWDIYVDSNHDSYIFSGAEACQMIYGKKMDFGIITPLWGKCIRKKFLEKILKKVERQRDNLKWTYLEDIYFGPIMFYNANTVKIVNSFLYAHRHTLSNLSSQLTPTRFHYETVEAGRMILQFWKENHIDDLFFESIPGYLLTVQRVWYQTVVYEKDLNIRRVKELDAVKAFEEYYSALKTVSFDGIRKLVKINFILFHFFPNVWKCTIGHLWFKGIYYWLYHK